MHLFDMSAPFKMRISFQTAEPSIELRRVYFCVKMSPVAHAMPFSQHAFLYEEHAVYVSMQNMFFKVSQHFYEYRKTAEHILRTTACDVGSCTPEKYRNLKNLHL